MTTISCFYSKNDNNPDQFIRKIEQYCKENDLLFIDICIDDDELLKDRYKNSTPAVSIGPYLLKSPFTLLDLEVAVKSTISKNEEKNRQQLNKHTVISITNLDKFGLFISKYYAQIILVFFLLFTSIPFLAPYLEKTNHNTSAQIIYKTYRIICHQLSFRSFFLFGEQPYYPRALAGIKNIKTYELVTGKSAFDLEFARDFIGSEEIGYKVALCERDIAIYGSLALFSLVFILTKKKIKGLSWIWWIIIALIPIGIDGFSQIPSLSSGWPNWIVIRESTPLIRIITGTLFGIGTGWYMLPLMEESLAETRINVTRKIAIVKKIQQQLINNDKNS